MSFLPVNREDMEKRGWDELEFLFVSGDAYVDHPSFGHAIITRILESEGYRVGIVAQPDWNKDSDFLKMGKPRLAVLIASGVIDSMVNHYTTSKKPRSDDDYSPGGKAGKRPDRALIVYANKIRQVMKDIPVIIGGLEASLRRFAHYDYWDDKVRRSVLVDSKADLLIYGMGEKPILEVADMLNKGIPVDKIKSIRGSAYISRIEDMPGALKSYLGNTAESGNPSAFSIVPSFEEVSKDKRKYAEAFKVQYDEQDAITGKTIIQKHGDRYLVQNPPAFPVETKTMDKIYSLPYERTYHPTYIEAGGIPAIEEVEFSITSHRGCYGGCSFCALNFHQGRAIQMRSKASLVNEAKKLTWLSGFKGYIHDVGGPTANFRTKACTKQVKGGVCKGKQCLFPEPCKNIIVDHSEYLDILRDIRQLPGIKKVFIRSGVRYDYLMLDKNDKFFNELCAHHVSGQLKVAPEHVVDRVLEKMGKPGRKVYDKFTKRFYEINKKINKEQYLVPYFISSHPGSDIEAAIELAEYLRDLGYNPEQVQDFYPTPGTLSTCMYYTGLDPRNMKPVYVPKSPKEKAMQRALLQFRKPQNYELVYEALKKTGREDLIGFGKKCLIRPRSAGRFVSGEGKKGGKAQERFASKATTKAASKGKDDRAGKVRGSDPKSRTRANEAVVKKKRGVGDAVPVDKKGKRTATGASSIRMKSKKRP
jgi:uncharacterized radical SAM protein YgiQ